MTITLTIPIWLLCLLPVAALVLFFELLWVHYLAVMKLKDMLAAKALRPVPKWFGVYVVLPIGYTLDWLGNLIASVIFLDPPAKPLEIISPRLQRYLDADPHLTTWRARWAWAFAETWLNDADQPEGHIKRRF